ncbi:sensor histidine kinase [Lacinutrix chionoecetis]
MELKKQQWKYHLLLATLIIAMGLYGDYVYNGVEGFMSNFTYPSFLIVLSVNISFFSIYAINYFLICPRSISKKKFHLFALAVIGLIFLFSGIRYFLEEVVIYNITGKHNYYNASRRFLYYTFDNSFYAVKAILFSTTLYLLFEYIDNQKRIHQLQLEHKKAELSFLKSQLEPHFLFNTLNSFYTDLVDTQPKTAKDIHRLSELLRYVTYEAQHDFMPLDKEIKFIEDYIYFYQKRFEDYLFLDYSIEGLVANQQIPSLMLIHFIENVFKHGVTNKKEHPAKINIHITEEDISITTENLVSSSEKYSNKGIGKENLERRLAAIFICDYKIEYSQNDTIFKAYLKLPFKK